MSDIDTVVIGVGQSWNPAKIDCIVDDPDNDIIAVEGFDSDSFDAVRDLTDSFLCPEATSIALSEVKPVPGNEHPVPFIELYNTGQALNLSEVEITLQGVFEGRIDLDKTTFWNLDNDSIWEADTYLVLFDNNDDVIVDPECVECLCNLTETNLCYDAIYIGCSDSSSCWYNSKLDTDSGEQNVVRFFRSYFFLSLSLSLFILVVVCCVEWKWISHDSCMIGQSDSVWLQFVFLFLFLLAVVVILLFFNFLCLFGQFLQFFMFFLTSFCIETKTGCILSAAKCHSFFVCLFFAFLFVFSTFQTTTFWYQYASAYDYTSIPYIFNVTYGQGSYSWLQALAGYSYYVTDIDSCSAQYGYCWGVSCSYYGTPGAPPIDSCSVNCTEIRCQSNGDSSATCDLEDDTCDCTSEDYFIPSSTGTTCEELSSPMTCTIYVNKSSFFTETYGTVIDQAYIEWDAVAITGYTPGYQLRYFDGISGELKYKNIRPNFRFTTLATLLWYIGNTTLNTSVATTYTDDNDGETTLSRWTICDVITTSPTMSPTPAPTPAFPPIRDCNALIITDSNAENSVVTIEWTPANLSSAYTYNEDQFDDNYRIFIWKVNMDTNDTILTSDDRESDYSESIDVRGATELASYQLDSKITNLESQYWIAVSAVIQDPDTGADLNELESEMIKYSTYCDISSDAPTAAPSELPTIMPTFNPSIIPTYTPTQAPTYALLILSNCVIEIFDKNDWTMTWEENNNRTHIPHEREIIVTKDGNEFFDTIENDERSPQDYLSSIDPTANVTLTVRQKLDEINGMQIIPESEIDCYIITQSPTNAPSNAPTMAPTTQAPTNTPTSEPTFAPSPAPTYYYSVAQCTIFVESSTVIELEFVIPEFDYPNTPANADDILYRLEIVDNGIGNVTHIEAFKPEDAAISGANITEIFPIGSSGYNAYNLTSHYYQLSIVWTGSVSLKNKFVSTSRECDIITKSPTKSPSIEPTNYPTNSPTFHPPGVWLSDKVCGGNERCGCDNSDFTCTSDDTDVSSPLEDPLTFEESNFVQNYFEIKRYPETYDHAIEIFWEFRIGNTTGSSRDDIIPFNGSITIDIDEESNWIATEFILENDEIDTDIASEKFELWLTGCIVIENSNNEEELQNCSVIFPSMTPVIISDTASSSFTIFEELGELPDFIWPLLLGGAAAFGAGGWLYYTRNKNKKMANEQRMQDMQPVSLMQGNVAGDLDANAQVQFAP